MSLWRVDVLSQRTARSVLCCPEALSGQLPASSEVGELPSRPESESQRKTKHPGIHTIILIPRFQFDQSQNTSESAALSTLLGWWRESFPSVATNHVLVPILWLRHYTETFFIGSLHLRTETLPSVFIPIALLNTLPRKLITAGTLNLGI